jgi:hypothetical protein
VLSFSPILEPFCPRPGFQKRLCQRFLTDCRIVSHHDFAEFFAELCATEAPIVPLYSIDYIDTPCFATRLLTEGL